MAESKWTPGPWHWTKDIVIGEYNLAPGILLTALTDGTPWGDEIDRANAHLIATAPDLYDALKALLDRYIIMGCGEGPEALAAKFALAKARGEQ